MTFIATCILTQFSEFDNRNKKKLIKKYYLNLANIYQQIFKLPINYTG